MSYAAQGDMLGQRCLLAGIQPALSTSLARNVCLSDRLSSLVQQLEATGGLLLITAQAGRR